MTVSAEAIRSINAYINTTAEIQRRVLNFITSQWNSLDSYRDAQINRFARAVSPVVEGAQIQLGSMTDGYLATLESEILGRTIRPVGIDRGAMLTQSLRGVSGTELWKRPGITIWNGLSNGKSIGQVVPEALSRALSLGKTNMQLAQTHSARSILERKDNVVGYRRTLTGGESCGLCFAASTQRYRKQDLMPIHPGCDCKVAPIYGKNDPGQVINSNVDFNSVDASQRFNQDSFTGKQARTSDLRPFVVVHEHGEIGPVLAVKGQDFTGPSDLG